MPTFTVIGLIDQDTDEFFPAGVIEGAHFTADSDCESDGMTRYAESVEAADADEAIEKVAAKLATEDEHSISIDEMNGAIGDRAWAAFCDAEGCGWRGEWHHADTQPTWPASIPVAWTSARAAAELDGDAHIKDVAT